MVPVLGGVQLSVCSCKQGELYRESASYHDMANYIYIYIYIYAVSSL